MRNRVLLFLLCVGFNLSFSQELINSKIDKVVVYLSGAKISRIAKANLKKGENILTVSGLSDVVDVNSIQARVKGDGALLSVMYRHNYLGQEKNSLRVRQLSDTVNILNLQLGKLTSEMEVYQNEKATLLKNDNLKGEQNGLSVADLKLLLDYQRLRGLELNDRIFKMTQQKIDLQALIAKCQRQIQELNGSQKRPQGEILLTVFANRIVGVDIELEYIVTDASWSPIYDIRVDNLEKPVDLVYKSQVRQNTGIDWEGVKMSISNGNPARYEDYPVLSTLYATTYEPVEYKKQKAATYTGMNAEDHNWGATRSAPAAMKDKELAKPEYKVVQKENQLTSEYEISIPQSIPSDNKEHLVNITSYELGVDFHYYAVPKINQSAFLLADIRDWGKYDLLAAEANIFFEGAYVGKTFIDPGTVNDTLSVSMGVDREVQVKRTFINEKSGTKVLATRKRVDYSYDFTVLNNKKQKINIEVLDQVPVAQKEEIEVVVETAGGGVLNDKNGQLKWQFDLEPSKNKKWEFAYSVKYPKNKQIRGTK